MRSVLQLHRTGRTSDWQVINPTDYNIWQKIASKTYGLVTPGNFLTLLGAVIVIFGLITLSNGPSLTGIGLLVLGRLADIADGLAADKTGTKSSFGEAFDASVDKILALASIAVFIINDLAPVAVLLLFAVLSILNSLVSIFYKLQKRAPHPTISGKLATAFIWMSLAGFLLADLYAGSVKSVLNVLAWLSFIAFICFGIVSSYSYIKQGRR